MNKHPDHRAKFLQTKLSLCFFYVDLAARRLIAGNRELAEQAIGSAEKGYSEMRQYVSDPKHGDQLTADQVREFTAELRRLREWLDGFYNSLQVTT